MEKGFNETYEIALDQSVPSLKLLDKNKENEKVANISSYVQVYF